jgi:DNA polymerase/3'-5' exonuclease PolX
MNKKITLTINGSRFDIDVDATFAVFLEEQMHKDMNMEGNNSFKTLLQAYIRKNYELYNQELELSRLLKKID